MSNSSSKTKILTLIEADKLFLDADKKNQDTSAVRVQELDAVFAERGRHSSKGQLRIRLLENKDGSYTLPSPLTVVDLDSNTDGIPEVRLRFDNQCNGLIEVPIGEDAINASLDLKNTCSSFMNLTSNGVLVDKPGSQLSENLAKALLDLKTMVKNSLPSEPTPPPPSSKDTGGLIKT